MCGKAPIIAALKDHIRENRQIGNRRVLLFPIWRGASEDKILTKMGGPPTKNYPTVIRNVFQPFYLNVIAIF